MPGKLLSIFVLALCLLAAACGGERRDKAIGYAYVVSDEATLRDRLGATSSNVGAAKAGERVELLGKRRRWARIRTGSGAEGWLEERHLIEPEIYERAQQMLKEVVGRPSQGRAKARSTANLHIDPERKSPRFFQLKEGEECDVLEHRAVERPLPPGTTAAPPVAAKKGAKKAPAGPPMEDWFLVRGSGKTGWALSRFFDMTISDEVAQYSEGKAITAWQVLNEVEDEGQKKPQYVWATSERVGAPYDFDGIRVFIWNTARNRYETAYRERNLQGVYPLVVGREKLQVGEVPSFSVTTLDAAGGRVTRNFVMLGTIVRRREQVQ